MQNGTRARGWLAVALLLAAAPRGALAFDLTGTWEVQRAVCKGVASTTSEPNPFAQKVNPVASTLAITQTGADLNVSFDRALVLFSGDLFDGFAFDLRKNGSMPETLPNRSVGAFVVCGGIPEDLQGTLQRTELATIDSAKLSGGGKAQMKLTVKAVNFGFEAGMSSSGNHVLTCTYKLVRVDTANPAVPGCP